MMLVVTVITTSIFANGKTDSIKVYGKCDMCKSRIEKAVTAIQGVTKADWNVDSKVLSVSYDGHKTSNEDIQKSIAAIGHDTEKYRATDATYQNLPSCCHYERKKA